MNWGIHRQGQYSGLVSKLILRWLALTLTVSLALATPADQTLRVAEHLVQSAGYGPVVSDWEFRAVGLDAYLCAGTLPDNTTVIVLVSAQSDPVPLAHHRSPLTLSELDARLAQAACRALGCDSVTRGELFCYSPLDLWQKFRSADDTGPPAVLVSLRDLSVRPAQPADFGPLPWSAGSSGTAPRSAATGMNWIEGVPDWDWHYGCAPTAAANVLTWWARRGFARLLDSVRYNVPDRLEGDTDSVPNVSDQLARAMNTDTLKTGCTSLDSIAPGILSVCNDPAWNNGYNFESFLAWNDHDLLIREIDAGRPGVLGLLGHPEYGSHAVTFCGWGPPDDRWIMVHDLWAGTPVDRVINFDYGGPVAVIPVVPGKSAAPDISIVAIIQPAESVAPGLITPQAELANDGSVSGTATACFRIIDELTGSDCYTASVAVTMEPDKRASVEFPAWQALAGNYVACCSLTMSGSTSPLSSVVRTRFTVAPARLAGGYAPIVRVSPNPASRTVIVSGWTGFGQASIFDPAGRLIHHSSLVTQNSSALLDLGSLPSGCYLLRLDRTGSTPVCCSFLVSH